MVGGNYMTSLENVIISKHLSNIYAEGELEKFCH